MAQRQATPNILDDLMSAAPAGVAKPATPPLRIADIRRDGGTQPRAGLDEAHVADLVAALANGDELPPVDVIFDGTAYWLYDGYHRVEATSRSGQFTVLAIIHQGTQADAQWASYSVNRSHGLKRTNDDKRRQVIAALRHPNGASMSNREIARHVGVDEGTVRDYRAKMEAAAEIPQVTERKGSDGKVYDTAKIGANRPAPQTYLEVWKLEQQASTLAKEWDTDPAMMREGARQQLGSYWGELTHRVNQVGQYRVGDLKQAINNVAHQMEAQANGTNYQAGPDLDPWVVAALTPGSRQWRVEALARTITPWIQEYRDIYGRAWQELALNGNPAHTSSTFWRDIGKECKRRTVTVADDTLKLAIKQAFAWLLAKESPKTQPGAAGRPMFEVLRTDEEQARDAEAADIASRNAAADEAERQARDQAFQDRMASEAAARRDAEYARQAAADPVASPGPGTIIVPYLDQEWQEAKSRMPADPYRHPHGDAIRNDLAARDSDRHTHLLRVLDAAMTALPEIGDLIGQRQFCKSVVVTLDTMRKELVKATTTAETPAPPPAAPATELPADLVAHGWELRRTRDGGRWIAAITPPDEEREITTVKRSAIDDVIGDCRYMERTLRIGVAA